MRTTIMNRFLLAAFVLSVGTAVSCQTTTNKKPNIILIYTDDLGYGDVSSYGTSAIQTQNIDRLAKNGVRFTNAHATSATCTPSRFSLLTGKYAWRKEGTGIAPGDATLLIPVTTTTLPGMLQKAGYNTAVIGKWHLGLGDAKGIDWNEKIKPGPAEIGFNYSFLIPATGDRVPCVFVENQEVVNLDKNDPITVSYTGPVDPNAPTGKKNPELLKMHPSHGHDMTIVNGISRIGYMKGGTAALWKDEDFANILVQKATAYITQQKANPFFLYFSTHDIHVPRVANDLFAGKSGFGPRGDVLLQLDWTVGQIEEVLKKNGLLENTLIIFTSDNGPHKENGGDPEFFNSNGIYRGIKRDLYEGGMRVPFIAYWPTKIKPAIVTQPAALWDMYPTFLELAKVPVTEKIDGISIVPLLSQNKGRQKLHDFFYWEFHENDGRQAVRMGKWKGVRLGVSKNENAPIELYNLNNDPSEQKNVAEQYPALVKEFQQQLRIIRQPPNKK